MYRFFGRKDRKRRQQRRSTMQVERLEDRCLLALSLTLSPPNAIVSQPLQDVPVAEISGAQPGSEFVSVIRWGDGEIATASTAAGSITEADGVFTVLGDHVYSASGQVSLSVEVTDVSGNRNPFVSTQATEGSGNTFQEGRHHFQGYIGVAHFPEDAASRIVPAEIGGLRSLTYSYRAFSRSSRSIQDGVGLGLLIKQGDTFYLADYQAIIQRDWLDLRRTVTANDFFKLTGSGPSKPVFSSTGGAIDVGYFTANSSSAQLIIDWGMDDFSVTGQGRSGSTAFADANFAAGAWNHIVLWGMNSLGAETVTASAAFGVLSSSRVSTETTTFATSAFPSPNLTFAAGVNFSGVLATVDTALLQGNVRAEINWGDGTFSTASSSDGTIIESDGIYSILGNHTYAEVAEGLPLTITLRDQYEPLDFQSSIQDVGPNNSTAFVGTHYFDSYIGVAHLFPGATIAPAPNLVLDYAFDLRTLFGNDSSSGVGVGVLLKQGSTYYLADYRGVGKDAWLTLANSVPLTSFTRLYGSGPAQPDVSGTAAAIEVGLYTANSTAGSYQSLTWGLANLSFSIGGQTFQPSLQTTSEVQQRILWGARYDLNVGTMVRVAAPLTTATDLLYAGENFTGPLAVLTPNPHALLTDYRAVIDWGDGHISTSQASDGTIVATPSGFSILGSHNIAPGGTNTVRVSIQRADEDAAFHSKSIVDDDLQDRDFLWGQHHFSGYIGVAHLFRPVGSYDPAVSGAIDTLEFSVDAATLAAPSSTDKVGIGFLIRQNNVYYTARLQGVARGNWTTITGNLAALDFQRLSSNGPSMPRFDADAPPLEFGIYSANSTTSNVARKIQFGLSEFHLVIHRGSEQTEYTDAAMPTTNWTQWTLWGEEIGGPVRSTSIPVATLAALPLDGLEGEDKEFHVANLTGAFSATELVNEIAVSIAWGDGSTSPGTFVIADGLIRIMGEHHYAFGGEYAVEVTIRDLATAQVLSSKVSTASIANRPLNVAIQSLQFQELTQYERILVATFFDGNVDANITDYIVEIDWGDGTRTNASALLHSLLAAEGGYRVFGSHTYTEPGLRNVTVKVFDLANQSGPFTGQLYLSGGPGNSNVYQGEHQLTESVGVAHISRAAAEGRYDPAVSGPLTSLDYSFAFKTILQAEDSQGVAAAFLVKQDGNYFIAGRQISTGTHWQTLTGSLVATDFELVGSTGPAHPDFSATGKPIEFGYYTSESRPGATELARSAWGAALFSVTINGTAYLDSQLHQSEWWHFIVDHDTPNPVAEASLAVNVEAAPIRITIPNQQFTEGTPIVAQPVATFRVATPNAANQYLATIDWGDGRITTASSAAGSIVDLGAGNYSILGSHTYNTSYTHVGVDFTVEVQELSGFVPLEVESTTHQTRNILRSTQRYQTFVGVAHISENVGLHSVYEPWFDGAITELDFTFDARISSGSGIGIGLLLRQADSYYVARYAGLTSRNWQTIAGTLTASDFVRFYGNGPQNPRFGTSAPPMSFGIYTANSSSGNLATVRWDLSNFQISINGTDYVDNTFALENWEQVLLASDAIANDKRLSVNRLIADPEIVITPVPQTFVANQDYENVILATFQDSDLQSNAFEYRATIDWGDGFVTTASAAEGTIVVHGNGYAVLGSHRYEVDPSSLERRVTVQSIGYDNDPVALSQVSSGGPNDSAYQRGVMTFLNGAWASQFSQLAADGGVYRPQTDGAINSLTFNMDFRPLASTSSVTEGLAMSFVVRQNGSIYYTDLQYFEPTAWGNHGIDLQTSVFRKLFGSGPNTPDFTSTGSAIEFGYVVAHTCIIWQRSTWGAANFSVTINGTNYTDTNMLYADWTSLPLYFDPLGAANASTTIPVSD